MNLSSETFPYVSGDHGTESEEHVRLKGIAVYWLLKRGFEKTDIEEEYPVEPPTTGRGRTRYADLYADDGGRRVFVECERGSGSARGVSSAGTQKAREGEVVLVFHPDDSPYRLERAEVYDERFDVTHHRMVLTDNFPEWL